jgi:glutamyl-tRNA synthetase
MPLDRFIAACAPWVTGDATPWVPTEFDPATFAALAPPLQERVAVLDEVPDMVDFAFLQRPDIDEEAWAKSVTGDPVATEILAGALASYQSLVGSWQVDTLKAATLAVAVGVDRKLGKAQAPIRLATMGRPRGLPLFDSLEVLGPDRTLQRLRDALARTGLDGR